MFKFIVRSVLRGLWNNATFQWVVETQLFDKATTMYKARLGAIVIVCCDFNEEDESLVTLPELQLQLQWLFFKLGRPLVW